MSSPSRVAITKVWVKHQLGHDLMTLHQSLLSEKKAFQFKHRMQHQLQVPLGILPEAEAYFQQEDLSQLYPLLERLLKEGLGQLGMKDEDQEASRDTALFIGSTSFAPQVAGLHSQLSSRLKQCFPALGACWTLASSCAASAQAIAQAYDVVRSGTFEKAIAGGIEIISPVTLHGFHSLQILDHEECRPFTSERKGINLGEGAVFFLLEKSNSPHALAYIEGYGLCSEAHHLVQPVEDGRYMLQAMQSCLAQAGRNPQEIAYINPHATGTLANDRAEMQALHKLFGDDWPVHCTKALTGHLLGAAGALEMAICLAILQNAKAWEHRFPLLQKNQPAYALSNSFGFGGANVSLLFSKGLLC